MLQMEREIELIRKSAWTIGKNSIIESLNKKYDFYKQSSSEISAKSEQMLNMFISFIEMIRSIDIDISPLLKYTGLWRVGEFFTKNLGTGALLKGKSGVYSTIRIADDIIEKAIDNYDTVLDKNILITKIVDLRDTSKTLLLPRTRRTTQINPLLLNLNKKIKEFKDFIVEDHKEKNIADKKTRQTYRNAISSTPSPPANWLPQISEEKIAKYGSIENIKNLVRITNTNKNIIVVYNDIKINLDKLETIKKYILSILETSENNFDERISKKQFKLHKKYLIEDFDEDINKMNEANFVKFKQEYISQNFNLIKGLKNNFPYFYIIFQSSYFRKDKDFFLELFKEYIKIRDVLIKQIKDNYGLLAFSTAFDMSDIFEFEKIKNSEKKKLKNSSENNNNKNNNKYSIYEDDSSSSSSSSSSPSSSSSSSSPPASLLNKKIHKIDLLYVNLYDESYYNNLHKKNISENYKNVVDAKNIIFTSSEKDSLYNVMKNLLELDFHTIKFLFTYVEPLLFTNFVSNHIKIKKYITNKLNNLELYFDRYKEWLEKIYTLVPTSSSSTIIKNEFDTFYNHLIISLI